MSSSLPSEFSLLQLENPDITHQTRIGRLKGRNKEVDSLKTLAIKKQHTRISLVGLTYPGQDAGEVYNLEPSPETDRKKLQKKPVPSGHRTRETVAE